MKNKHIIILLVFLILFSAVLAYTTVKTINLVGAWRFEGNANDWAGNNNGTVFEAALTMGKFGQAYTFDGVDDFIEFSYSTVFDLGSTWTISYWIKPTSGNKTLSTRSGGSAYETGVNVGANFFIEFYGNNSPPSGQQQTSGITPIAGTWYYFVVVANGSTVKILIDCVEYKSFSYSKSVTANGNPLRIGHAAFYNEGQNAVVDELRIFNRALNVAEIRALMLNYDPGEF